MDARKREKTNVAIGKKGKKNVHSRKRESVGSTGNRAANFVDGFIGDGAAVTKRNGAREGRKGGNVVGRRCDKVTEWKRRRIMRHRKPNIVPRWQRGNSAVGSLIGKG